MKGEVFRLLLFSAAAAYLFYYVIATHGGYFADLSAAALSLYLIGEWSQLFYRLGRGA